jgi:hypothetical protein
VCRLVVRADNAHCFVRAEGQQFVGHGRQVAAVERDFGIGQQFGKRRQNTAGRRGPRQVGRIYVQGVEQVSDGGVFLANRLIRGKRRAAAFW